MCVLKNKGLPKRGDHAGPRVNTPGRPYTGLYHSHGVQHKMRGPLATLVTIATRKAVTVLPARAPLGGIALSAAECDGGASFARRFGLLIAEVRPRPLPNPQVTLPSTPPPSVTLGRGSSLCRCVEHAPL